MYFDFLIMYNNYGQNEIENYLNYRKKSVGDYDFF